MPGISRGSSEGSVRLEHSQNTKEQTCTNDALPSKWHLQLQDLWHRKCHEVEVKNDVEDADGYVDCPNADRAISMRSFVKFSPIIAQGSTGEANSQNSA